MLKPVTSVSTYAAMLAVLVGLVGGTPASRAADASGHYAIDGIGSVRCDRFVADAEARNRRLSEYGGWVTGYLTALNRFNPETFDVTPWQGTQFLVLALVNYCRQNAELLFHRAVADLSEDLWPDKLAAQSDFVSVEQDGKRMLVYAEVVRRLQQRLKDLGFPVSAVDGQYGPNTAGALRQFQTRQGLTPTGLPDQVTLNQLLYLAAGGAN